MEIFYYVLWATFVYGSPFISFAIGVLISIRLRLHGDLAHEHVWLMAIPIGLLTIGNLLMITTVSIHDEAINETIVKLGHMNSVGQFLVFIGTLMLYGTLVPQLFNQARDRLRERATHVVPPGHDPGGGA